MNIYLMVFSCFLILSSLSPDPSAIQAIDSEKMGLMQIAKNEKGGSREESRSEGDRAIEAYEREKLAKFKQNIGKRYLVVRTVRPMEFQHSPEEPKNTFSIQKEKEGFVIIEVVQNQSGTMNFYRVKFDTGQIGYLSADGNYLQIKIKEGSLISVSKRGSGRKKDLSQSRALAFQAVELVKDHLTLADPVTGAKKSVEKRMMDQKMSSFPNLKWRYEAKEIGSHQHRVTQYAGEGAGPPLIRTWIVDLSTREVKPENLAAKELYR